MNVIEMTGVVKQYGSVLALDHVSMSIPRGQIVAILGPNGAGKTTLLEILEGLQRADAGEIHVLDTDIRKNARDVKNRIGISLQNTSFFDRLSVEETLHLFGAFFSYHRSVEGLLKHVGLFEKRHQRISQLSGGQQQRVALALALINDPELVFLDEPTTGLDPAARRDIWTLVESMRQEGRTVLLTTHYMEEAAYLADTVVIMDHGKILVQGTVDQLLRDYAPEQTVVLEGEGLDYLMQAPWNFHHDHDQLIAHVVNAADQMGTLLDLIRRQGGVIHRLSIREATLEDVFLRLTGRRLAV